VAVLAIEWRISQHLKQSYATNCDQVMDHFLKVCIKSLHDFCAKFIFMACFGRNTFIVGKIPIHHFNPYYIMSIIVLIA